MKRTLLKDLVKEYSPISDSATFKVEIYPTINEVKSEQPVDICTYSDFMNRCRYVHGFKSFLHFEDDNAKAEFTSLWYLFKTNYSNLRSWEMKYNAYFSEYNPIDNYDKHSKIETEYEGEEQNSYIGGETTTTSNSGSDTLTKQGKERTTDTKQGKEVVSTTEEGKEFNEKSGTEHNYKLGEEEHFNVPFENNQYAPESKTKWSNDYEEKTTYGDTNDPVKDTKSFSQDRKTKVTTEYPMTEGVDPAKPQRIDETTIEFLKDEAGHERNDSRTYSDSGSVAKEFSDDRVDVKSFVGRKDTVTERTHGNVGTTKASDIINSEWELRKLDLCYSIIDSFVNQYCTLLYTDV